MFQKASDAFSPIISKPKNGDLQRLNKVLVVCCLSVTLNRTAAGSPSIVVLPHSVYKANHRGMFLDFMQAVRADYNPTIQNLAKDDRALMMRGLKHSWVTGTANQSRIRAIEVGAHNLILANVKPICVKELSVPGTFYTSAAVHTILDHLKKDGTDLNRPAGVELIINLHQLWESDPCDSQFIINMEEAHKKSVQAQVPITDGVIATFAAFMLLKANTFLCVLPV